MSWSKRFIRDHSVWELLAMLTIPYSIIGTIVAACLIYLVAHLSGQVAHNVQTRNAQYTALATKLNTLQARLDQDNTARDIYEQEIASLSAQIIREGGDPTAILREAQRQREQSGLSDFGADPSTNDTRPSGAGSASPSPSSNPSALPSLTPSASPSTTCAIRIPLIGLCLP